MLNCTGPEKPKCQIPGEHRARRQTSYTDGSSDITCYLCSILLDCHNNYPQYGRTELRRDCETISRRFTHEGMSFATRTLPDFFDAVLRYLETGISTFPGFLIKRGSTHPVFLQRLVAPIYEDPYGEDTVKCMGMLYQLCYAFKKLRGPYRKSVLKNQLLDFVETDHELRYIELASEANIPILAEARKIIAEVTKGLDPSDLTQSELFLPRPGPGATNTPTKAHERFQALVKYTTTNEVLDFVEWFNPPTSPPRSRQRWCDDDRLSELWFADPELPLKLRRPWDLTLGTKPRKPLKEKFESTSRFKFVPKTYSKARGICIEELEIQYLQQGIKNALYHRIEAHPLTRGFVNFADQSVNGGLALDSSRDWSLATFDMSSGSDRISRALVQSLFRDNKALLDAMLALSTRKIELPEEVWGSKILDSAKFAPMGSALCFPIMSLVHFALIKAIILLSATPRSKTAPVYVYGDDLIFPVEHAQAVIDWLPRFGMKLNVEKSFWKSAFRESCGVHAYNGVNITPTRFKNLVKRNSPPNEVVSALINERDLFKKGYKETACLIRSRILECQTVRANQFLEVGYNSPVLGWIREQADLRSWPGKVPKRRWNAKYQRYEFYTRVVSPFRERLPDLDEVSAYLRKLVGLGMDDDYLIGDPPPRQVNDSCSYHRVRYKWVPESAFA